MPGIGHLSSPPIASMQQLLILEQHETNIGGKDDLFTHFMTAERIFMGGKGKPPFSKASAIWGSVTHR